MNIKLNRQSKRLLVMVLVALVYFIYNRYNKINTRDVTGIEVTNNFEKLIYTKHALCRMECREVRKEEIRQIVGMNKVNQNKSDYNDKPCPTIAYEGISDDGQHLRIIIANCNKVSKVVTAIDLDNEYNCHCD